VGVPVTVVVVVGDAPTGSVVEAAGSDVVLLVPAVEVPAVVVVTPPDVDAGGGRE